MTDQVRVENVYGVHGTCYSIKRVLHEEYQVDVPIGCHVARYDMKQRENPRISTFQCHDSTISDIQSHLIELESNIYYEITATCSYDGTLRLWNPKYSLLCTAGSGNNHPISRV